MRVLLGLLVCLNGCSALSEKDCSVGEEQVAAVRQRCEARYSGQGLDSALGSLQREISSHEAGGSCERFKLFLKSHCD